MGEFIVQMIYITAIFVSGVLIGEKYGANSRNS